jgi:hypothetical protein
MTAAIIELNDHELRLAKDGQIIARSPGCAIVKGTEVQVGEAACQQAHLHPRDYHNRFWYQLDQISLRKSSRAARHHADLAFRHLEHLHKAAGAPETVIFAIPGGFSKEQIALLLGIAEACDIKTVALVDAAVASAADCVAPGVYRHIEIQLHRTVITDLAIDGEVVRGDLDIVDGAGFDKLAARVVAFIADQFLAQSRFDPLHQADTEQMLFNALPNWLQLLHERREIKVQIEHRHTRFEATIPRDDIVTVARPLYNDIRARIAAHDRCLVGARLAALPGFIDAPATEFALPESAVFGGCESLVEQPAGPGGGLHLATQLKASEAPRVGASRESRGPRHVATSTAVATHVLCGTRAYELTTAPLYLTADGDAERVPSARSIVSVRRTGSALTVSSENAARLRLNGRHVDGDAPASTGDEITVEGIAAVYLPISVVSPDAP